MKRLLIGVAVVAIALIVAALNHEPGTGDPVAHVEPGPENTTTEAEPELDMSRRVEGDPLAMGRVDAPVVLVEYADFRCPFCGVFARDTQPELVSRYVEAGILRIEWRDLPVFGDQSVDAALAARAAARQDRFWEFHHAVYGAAPARGKPDLPRERLVEFAAEAGVPDLERFEADMDDAQLRSDVQNDLDEATSLGATSTPVFLVNDRPIVGAQPLDVFAAAIEAEAP